MLVLNYHWEKLAGTPKTETRGGANLVIIPEMVSPDKCGKIQPLANSPFEKVRQKGIRSNGLTPKELTG